MRSLNGTITIRGGLLALPAEPSSPGRARLMAGDLQIVDGRITQVGQVDRDRGELIHAKGLLVMAGVIDPQVHFREPGFTHKEDIGSGSVACAAGGVTAFLEMPNTDPPTVTREALAHKKQRAAATSLVDYGFFIGATPENLEVQNDVEEVPGIKMFMGSSTGNLLVEREADQERIFAYGRRLIAVHAEDEARLRAQKLAFGEVDDARLHPHIRDEEVALIATRRALFFSERYQRRLHILHLSTKQEIDLIRAAGKGGGRLSCEVTPQHLFLWAPQIYERLHNRAKMNPPLRERDHGDHLLAALIDGTIDCVATDHAPHTLDEKNLPYARAPAGMPGVETVLSVMLDASARGLIPLEVVVERMTEAPARLYQITGKGQLRSGFDGDLTLVDRSLVGRVEDRPIRSRVGWNPFEGLALRGWPVATFVRGVAVYRDGEVLDAQRGEALRFGGVSSNRSA